MSEKEYKEKCNNMFAQNSILLHRIDELEKDKEWLDNTNNEQTKVILQLNEQIEKMQQDQKTAFWKGMRHFANAIKKYDSKNGAATDYLEHTVNIVLNHEACKFCKHRKTKKLTGDKTGYLCDRRVCTGICFEGKE